MGTKITILISMISILQKIQIGVNLVVTTTKELKISQIPKTLNKDQALQRQNRQKVEKQKKNTIVSILSQKFKMNLDTKKI